MLVPFQTVGGASGAFPDGSVPQTIWCVRLEKPEDNQRLAHSCSPVGEALLFSSP